MSEKASRSYQKDISKFKEARESHANTLAAQNDSEGTATGSAISGGGKRKAVVKQGNRGNDIFESGLIAKPENAYFVTDLRGRKRSHLVIPNKLIVKWNLKIPEKINIVAEDGKKFASVIATWGDGKTIATDGWRAFCRWNFVKADEMCLCEFVTNQELLVRIVHFHAGKWMPRQRG